MHRILMQNNHLCFVLDYNCDYLGMELAIISCNTWSDHYPRSTPYQALGTS
ncbi:unnamed protein product [Fusarium graminearum]|uniref:Chromosome 4, complete genome n=1 Tax=Gibberella zeae (strain ATCC MYA-4620 / CBS 123657 / FGSC 9075 / NRRL 31084 / PH-1) TaxID=229533 RepID=A0A098DRL0_GIBZE|nr:unnamed protein product [Fusarium graminearum]